MNKKYFGSWSSYEKLEPDWAPRENYRPKLPIPDFPTDEEILFASYGGVAYEGDATVIFERGGKLFEAHGTHCSCFGLEDQWKPEETSWAALAMRKRTGTYSWDFFLGDHDDDARKAYWALVDAHQ
jgi:hypothetical protein